MATELLDDLDRRILMELQEDGRRSYREIASRVGAAAGTVRARATQLMADGLVEIVAVPNPWRMGLRFFALLGLRLEPGRADEVAGLLTPRPEVTWVGLAATGYDVMAEVALHDAQEFGHYKQDVLALLPGFVSVDVYLLWDVRKLHYRFDPGWGGSHIPLNDEQRIARPATPSQSGVGDEADR